MSYDYEDGYLDEEYLSGDIYDHFESLPERVASDSIKLYIWPILLLVATVGNILNVVIMFRLAKKIFSTCIYLCVIALIDILVLYIRCGNDWISLMSHTDVTYSLMLYSESICKVFPFVFSFLFHFSRWLIVTSAIEGAIASKYPHKALRMCTLDRAKAIMLLLVVLLVCINIHYFWTQELFTINEQYVRNGLICSYKKHGPGHQYSEEFVMYIRPVLEATIAEAVPYIVITVCVCNMLGRIVRGRHRGDEHHIAWCEKYMLDPNAMNQLKVTILVLCIYQFALNMPKLGFTIFVYLFEKFEAPSSMKVQIQLELINTICTMLWYISLSCKFVVYVISCKRFRMELRSIFQCKRNNGMDKIDKYEEIPQVRRPLVKSATCNSSSMGEPPNCASSSIYTMTTMTSV